MTPNTKSNGGGLKSLILKEDWWAVWIGLGTVIVALILVSVGSNLKGISVSFPAYDNFLDLPGLIAPVLPKWIVLYIVLTVVFSIAAAVMGRKVSSFIAGFTLLFLLSTVVQILA